MHIDFGAIGTVAGVGFVAAVSVVLLYTLGLRLLGTGQPVDTGGERTQYNDETPRSGTTPPLALAGAGLCFAVCAAAVLYGIWLTVPQFHSRPRKASRREARRTQGGPLTSVGPPVRHLRARSDPPGRIGR